MYSFASSPSSGFFDRVKSNPSLFNRRRVGTGRTATARTILGIEGRRTGIALKQVAKDSEGFDDLEAVFADMPMSSFNSPLPSLTNISFSSASTISPPAAISPAPSTPPEDSEPEQEQEEQEEEEEEVVEDNYEQQNISVQLEFADEEGAVQSGPDIEEEEIIEPPVNRKPAAANNNSKRRKRRETTRMLEEMEEEGAMDETEVGRGKRRRFKPLQWWKGETVVYSRSNEGLAATLPVIKVINKARPTPQNRRTTRRTKKRVQKNVSEHPASSEDTNDSEIELKYEKKAPVSVPVRNTANNSLESRLIVKSESSLSMESLGSSSSTSATAKGGKAFEQAEFSSGLLVLPPKATKQREMANAIEVFYVSEGANEALELSMNGAVVKLSKGDTFTVPYGNVYTLSNVSASKPVKLHFTLIPPVTQQMEKLQQQLEA